MSVAQRHHLRKLQRLLARTDDREFLQLTWAVDALQSGRSDVASIHLTYPPDAAVDSSTHSRLGIHSWELETLITQLLLTPKVPVRPGPTRRLNCGMFQSMAETVNRLRKVENIEAGLSMPKGNVFNELHRIGQRQFHWQRGYFNMPQLYRYAFIYGQGKCGNFLKERCGLSVSDIVLVGFCLYSQFQKSPWLGSRQSVPQLGLTQELFDRTVALLARSLSSARQETKDMKDQVNAQHKKALPIAFLPSTLRQTPLFWFDERPDRLVAPIPELILQRVTAGIYYDLRPGGQTLLQDANERFEQYCADFISSAAPRLEVSREYDYGTKGVPMLSPDILIKDAGKLVVVVECKATKLTYLAQFAEDPFGTQRQQYEQLSKGVFQTWRFFSHVRRGLACHDIAADASALVLMLDPFLVFGGDIRVQVLDRALVLANADPDILEEDRRPVEFCTISDVEDMLLSGSEDTFLAALKATGCNIKYRGWNVREVHRDTIEADEKREGQDYPFSMDSMFPWWKRIEDLKNAAPAI